MKNWTFKLPTTTGTWWWLEVSDDALTKPRQVEVSQHPEYDYLVGEAPEQDEFDSETLEFCYGGCCPSLRSLWAKALPTEPKLKTTGTIELVNKIPTTSGRYWVFDDTPGNCCKLSLAVVLVFKGGVQAETLNFGRDYCNHYFYSSGDKVGPTWWARVPLYGAFPSPVIKGVKQCKESINE